MLQPTKSYLEKTGIMVCKSLVIPDDCIVPVRVFNAGTDVMKIQKGSTLAVSEPVTAFYRYQAKPKEECQECSCICDCIPTPDSEPETYNRPCCHKFNQMSHEEKYKYMWMDEYKKSPVVYSKFEADKDILPHVRDLYFQGIPHLEK